MDIMNKTMGFNQILPNYTAFVSALTEWFEASRRELPWRKDREPYHVWVSEIMLQQTRIEAVKRYYLRFMEALPDVASLSEVPDDALLKLWEGLGYYSRARNLKKAAGKIMREYGGAFPDTCAALLTLPGVGEYTAGAIASICFDEKVPAVDGNVLRVMARVNASRENVLLPETKKAVAAYLTAMLPEHPGVFNEALMELGELVCLPGGTPLCEKCPVKSFCVAYRDGLTETIPVRVKQNRRRQEQKTVLILTSPGGRVAIEQRPAKGLLAGMYQFPNADGFLSAEEMARALHEWGLRGQAVGTAIEAKHVFTHIDWYMRGQKVDVTEEGGDFLWVTPEALAETYALPAAFRPFLPLLCR